MSIEPVVSLPLADASRKVWVLNRYSEDYRETWKGREIVVKANGEKELLMPVLEANRFLGRPSVVVTQNDLRPDGSFPVIPKALYIVELTKEERMKIEGKSEPEVQKLNMCSVCGDSFPTEKGLGLHVRRKHSDLTAVKDE
jgi:hypothetical protein